MALRVTARIAAFMPEASPPEVRTPMNCSLFIIDDRFENIPPHAGEVCRQTNLIFTCGIPLALSSSAQAAQDKGECNPEYSVKEEGQAGIEDDEKTSVNRCHQVDER